MDFPLSALARRVRQTIRRRVLFADGDRVAVAVSGGSDSVALACLLRDLEADAGWHLAGLIHVHHGLRGAEADEDEAFCRRLAERLGLPIHVAHVDARAHAQVTRQSIEAAARAVRYEAFVEGAAALGATVVATGHTADDQAETVLLRLFRGATTRGLSAIRAKRGLYARPVIDCRREDLLAHLSAGGQTFRTDSSNAADDVPRNRLRRTVMPLLARDWPRAVVALARFAELAADDEALLAGIASGMAPALVQSSTRGVQLDVRGLADAPPALARRVVRSAVEAAGGTCTFLDVEAIRRLARADKTKGHLDIHGLAVDRRGPTMVLGKPRPSTGPPDQAVRRLDVPGIVNWPATGALIRASLQEGVSEDEWRANPPERAVLSADRVLLPLAVRTRRAGDRFRPLGASGSRKLQDVLVDRKVPGDARDAVPIVVDRTGRIVWVAGVAMADECRVTTPSGGVVILEMTKGIQ